MTYSIGFRAPSHGEILSAFTDEMVTQLDDKQCYTDADLQLQQHSSEINAQALKKIHDVIRNSFSDTLIDNWFGKYITEPKSTEWLHYPDHEYTTDEFIAFFERHTLFYRNDTSRLAFIDNDDGLRLFVDGEIMELAPECHDFVLWLCESHEYSYESFLSYSGCGECREIMTQLYNQGVLLTNDSDE